MVAWELIRMRLTCVFWVKKASCGPHQARRQSGEANIFVTLTSCIDPWHVFQEGEGIPADFGSKNIAVPLSSVTYHIY